MTPHAARFQAIWELLADFRLDARFFRRPERHGDRLVLFPDDFTAGALRAESTNSGYLTRILLPKLLLPETNLRLSSSALSRIRRAFPVRTVLS